MRPPVGQALELRAIGAPPPFVSAEERLRAAQAADAEARRIEACAQAATREAKRARTLRDVDRTQGWAERLIDDDIPAAAAAVHRVRDMLLTARRNDPARTIQDAAAVRLAHADHLARQALARLLHVEDAVWNTPEHASTSRRRLAGLGVGLVAAGALIAAALGAPEAVGAITDAVTRLP